MYVPGVIVGAIGLLLAEVILLTAIGIVRVHRRGE